MLRCRITCLQCGQDFDSPFQFGDAEAFFTCILVGKTVYCRECRKATSCTKENMKYVSEDAKEDEPVDVGEGRS